MNNVYFGSNPQIYDNNGVTTVVTEGYGTLHYPTETFYTILCKHYDVDPFTLNSVYNQLDQKVISISHQESVILHSPLYANPFNTGRLVEALDAPTFDPEFYLSGLDDVVSFTDCVVYSHKHLQHLTKSEFCVHYARMYNMDADLTLFYDAVIRYYPGKTYMRVGKRCFDIAPTYKFLNHACMFWQLTNIKFKGVTYGGLMLSTS